MSSFPRRDRPARATRSRFSVALVVSFFACLLIPGASFAADTAAPVVTSSSATPSFVNVTTGSQVVTINFHVTDDSGLKVSPVITAASDLNSHSVTAGVTATLLKGTPLNGDYQAKLTVPRGAVGGGWTATATLVDHPGNASGSLSLGTFTVFALGFDTVAPKLVSSSITPASIDVTTAAQTVTVSLHVTDDYTGTTSPIVTVTAPGGTAPNAGGPAILTAGDKNDGTWTLTATIPKGTPSGVWTVGLAPLKDQAGNTSGQATALGTITVKGGPAVTGGGDGSGGVTTIINNSSTTNTSTGGSTTTTTSGGQNAVLGTTAKSKPYLTLVSKSVKAAKKTGTITASLKCNGFTACRGSVRFYRTVKGKKVKVVSRRVSVAAGKTIKVKFKLTKAGKKVLLKGKKYSFGVSIWTDGIAAPRTAKLAVKRPR